MREKCTGANHVFIWAGDIHKIPENWHCTCGARTFSEDNYMLRTRIAELEKCIDGKEQDFIDMCRRNEELCARIAGQDARIERVEALEKTWRGKANQLNGEEGILSAIRNYLRAHADELAAALAEKEG